MLPASSSNLRNITDKRSEKPWEIFSQGFSLHYQDYNNREIDAVISLPSGEWCGFEIKLGENKLAEGANSLRRLKEKIALNPAAENPNPAFMAVIVGAGEYARFDKDTGIYVIPITALGA